MSSNLERTDIARRVLRFVTQQGTQHEVVVCLGPLGPGLAPGECRCSYRISGPEISVANYATGIDGIQAIQLAIVMIETELEVRLSSEGELLWEDGKPYTQ